MADLDSFGLVIFGASGDLTFRKLIPSLLHLYSNGKFGQGFFVLGTGRTGYSSQAYRDYLRQKLHDIEVSDNLSELDAFLAHVKSAHAGVLQAIVDAGYVLTEDVDSKMADIAEAFTTGYSP